MEEFLFMVAAKQDAGGRKSLTGRHCYGQQRLAKGASDFKRGRPALRLVVFYFDHFGKLLLAITAFDVVAFFFGHGIGLASG